MRREMWLLLRDGRWVFGCRQRPRPKKRSAAAIRLALTLVLAVPALLAQEPPPEGGNEVAPLHFKQLAGPPTEFADMAPRDPMSAATHSKSALLPVTLEGRGSRWTWDSALPLEGGRTRIWVLPGAPSRAAGPWDLTITDPLGGMAQLPERRPTAFGLLGGTVPAELYEFENLAAVDWHVRIESTQPGTGFILVEDSGPARLLSYQATRNQRVGERIAMIATVYEVDAGTEASDRPEVGEALLRVITPDGRALTSDMYDDGLHRDGQPGDGIYGGEFLADGVGDFRVQVVFTGRTSTGSGFIRTAEHLIPVVGESLELGSRSAEGRQLGDHRLRIGLDVSAPETSGHYRVYAEVWGTDPQSVETSRPVAWVGGMARVEDGGLHLGLDTRWIALSGAAEPFELRNVRVEEPDHFIALSSAERIPLAMPALPTRSLRSPGVVVDEEMRFGPRPDSLNYSSGVGHKKLLVHGYCSSNVWGPQLAQFDNAAVFLDLDQNRTHDEFAQLILLFGAPWSSYSIVAHSQGGLASLHLYNYYWSGLDNAGPGRLIQSVGSPYLGTPVAVLAIIQDIWGCGYVHGLSTSGAEHWLAGIASFARAEVNYYTTSFSLGQGNDYCLFSSDLLLNDPEDGVVEMVRGQLPGGVNQGHKVGWCHSADMRDPPQTTDSSRNLVMNQQAAVGSQDLIVVEMAVSDTTLDPGQSFTVSAAVHNQGDATSEPTLLRYYRSTDPAISTSDAEISARSAPSLLPGAGWSESHSETINVLGTFWIGACVDAVPGEANPGNNCSTGRQVTVMAPDLIVTSMTVADRRLETGQAFMMSATAHNQGNATSEGTLLRYCRSTDPTISTSDAQLSFDDVPILAAGASSPESAFEAIYVTGTFWIGACVDAVPGEANTGNNCSTGVEVEVSCSDALLLTNETVGTTEVFEACSSLTARTDFGIVGPGGNATFRAGTEVVLGGGFFVGLDAVLSVEIGPVSP